MKRGSPLRGLPLSEKIKSSVSMETILTEEHQEKGKAVEIAAKKNHFDRGFPNSENPYQNPLFHQRALLLPNYPYKYEKNLVFPQKNYF